MPAYTCYSTGFTLVSCRSIERISPYKEQLSETAMLFFFLVAYGLYDQSEVMENTFLGKSFQFFVLLSWS